MIPNQGLLDLEGFSLESTPRKKTKAVEVSPPKKLKPLPKPRVHLKESFSYAEYLAMHCGNAQAALYWYVRHGGKMAE